MLTLAVVRHKAGLFGVRCRIQGELRQLASKEGSGPVEVDSADSLDPVELAHLGRLRVAYGCVGRTWS